MLLDYNKKELEELARLYGIRGVSKLKKAELVTALAEWIPNNMSNGLVMLSIQDLHLFEEILAKDMSIEDEVQGFDFYNLVELGLVNLIQTKDGEVLSADKRIKQAYKKINHATIREQVQINSEIRAHIMGLLNLYGAVELDWVCELYARYHSRHLSQEQLIDFARKDRLLSNRSQIEGDYIAEETICSIDVKNLYDFIKITKNKPYYIPTKEYIELISDEAYYDNTLQVQNLKSYIKKNFTQDPEIIEDAILAVVMITRVDCDKNGTTITLMLEEWSYMGIEIKDLKQANETVKHITAVMNTTRKWINRGYTPQELSPNIARGEKRTKVTKLDVGGNALCSCGSGKKYKECCGKQE